MDEIEIAYLGILSEMAAPTKDIENMTFYHGTSSKAAAEGIMKDGIKTSGKVSKASLTPVKGAAYVTPHIHYAQIYALGGDMAGSTHKMSDEDENPHGHVFKISGNKLKDVQPDEDSIGEMVGNKKGPAWLHHLAAKHLTSGTMSKVREGDYASFARAGKKLVSKMADHEKIDLIVNHGAHVANLSSIKPDEAYRIDKSKKHLLKSDGSNFFDHAEKVNLE